MLSGLSNLTRFVLFAMMVGFCISAEYSITRPASHSIFLSVFTTQGLPMVWLFTIPFNLLLVSCYNWLLPKFGPLKITLSIISLVAGINFLMPFLLQEFPNLIFFHFCWKDVYILFMFQQLWSMIHCTIPPERAKYLYGLIFGFGTFAMTLGSLLPSLCAIKLGSEKLFFVTAPLYALLAFFYVQAFRLRGDSRLEKSMQGSVFKSFSFVVQNRLLLGILFLVSFMQISVALVEYQFSHHLEISFPQQDLRTSFFAKILCFIHILSLSLQILGSLYLFTKLSIRTNHIMVPLLLCLAAFGQWLLPGFVMVCSAFVLTKSIDWSIFGVMREMLFTKLSVDEKFRAKAVIDIFAYRSSKAVASLLLLGAQFYIGAAIFSLAKTIAFAILTAWLILVLLLFRKKSEQVAIESKI